MGHSHRRPPTRVATSSTTAPSHAARSTLLRAQSLPPVNASTQTRFLTPPPTPAAPSRTRDETLTPQPARNRVESRDDARAAEYRPTPIYEPERLHTLLYPLLIRENMLEYFRHEDGVSMRPPEGRYESLIQLFHC